MTSDGLAWMGPVLREYVLSEALWALGIPTTRALAAVSTGVTHAAGDAAAGKTKSMVCAACHGGLGNYHYSQHPDLARMNKGTHELFSQIMLEGLYSKNGMASFSNSLSEEEVESIHHFLIREKQKLYKKENE